MISRKKLRPGSRKNSREICGDDEKQYPVTFMCDQFGVTRQGYYRWRAAGPCQRERTDAKLTEVILVIHAELDVWVPNWSSTAVTCDIAGSRSPTLLRASPSKSVHVAASTSSKSALGHSIWRSRSPRCSQAQSARTHGGIHPQERRRLRPALIKVSALTC